MARPRWESRHRSVQAVPRPFRRARIGTGCCVLCKMTVRTELYSYVHTYKSENIKRVQYICFVFHTFKTTWCRENGKLVAGNFGNNTLCIELCRIWFSTLRIGIYRMFGNQGRSLCDRAVACAVQLLTGTCTVRCGWGCAALWLGVRRAARLPGPSRIR